MKHQRVITAISALLLVFGITAGAAGVRAQAIGDRATIGDGLGQKGWLVGSLGSATATQGDGDTLSAMRAKTRAPAGWSIPLGLAEDVRLRPWANAGLGLEGGREVSSGLLMDITLGSFTFTPSIATSFGNALTLSETPARLRSQFEIGYRFDNTSQLVLGYGRVTPIGSGDGDFVNHDVVSLSYRLPFGSILDW